MHNSNNKHSSALLPSLVRKCCLVVLFSTFANLAWISSSFAACSPYAGQATFNEYYFGNSATNFLEVYIKNINNVPQSAWQGWRLRV
ncbi:MAG TPA: hypothetical protein VIQ03_11755, partial [Gammaproteobacteria bacterium]